MFYSDDILRKRDGRFGIIWIAATKAVKLSRREILSVNVPSTCEDIINFILKRIAGKNGMSRPRLSLYLSSKLMYGVTCVHQKQVCFVFSELTNMINNYQFSLLHNLHNIDMKEKKSKGRTALNIEEEEDFNPDFGRFVIIEPDFHLSTAEETAAAFNWTIPTTTKQRRIIGNQIYQSPRDQITIVETPMFAPPEPDIRELPSVPDDFFLQDDSFLLSSSLLINGDQSVSPEAEPPLGAEPPIAVEPPLGAEPPIGVEPLLGAEPPIGVEPPLERVITNGELPPEREILQDMEPLVNGELPIGRELSPEGEPQTDGIPPDRHSPHMSPQVPTPPVLQLDPVIEVTPRRPRRRRRRNLIVDANTQISSDEIRDNLRNPTIHCRSDFEHRKEFIREEMLALSRRTIPVGELFMNPGRRDFPFHQTNLSTTLKSLFRRHMVTIPDPNAVFEIPQELLTDVEDQSISPIAQDGSPTVDGEQPERSPEPQEVQRPADATEREFASYVESSREIPAEISQEPVKSIRLPTPAMERVPVVLKSQEVTLSIDSSQLGIDEGPAFLPDEYELLEEEEIDRFCPSLNEVLQQIEDLRRGLDTGEVLTFQMLCPPTGNTKMKAAKMFSRILEMHKFKQIFLSQYPPHTLQTQQHSEIYIHNAERFDHIHYD